MPPAHEAEAERIRALPRKELQALAKELGVKANGKTVTILDDVLAALEAQVSSAEASPLEQKPGSPNHTASPAQDTGCHRACPVSHEQTGAACQHEMSAASPENAHIESEHARTKQVPTASNVSGSHFQEASMAVQHAEQVNSAADPPPEPVTVSSNPFFEPANAVPSTAADDVRLTDIPKGTTAQQTMTDAPAVLPAEAGQDAAEPMQLPSGDHLLPTYISGISPGANAMAAGPSAAAVEAAKPQQGNDGADVLGTATRSEAVTIPDNDNVTAVQACVVQLDPPSAAETDADRPGNLAATPNETDLAATASISVQQSSQNAQHSLDEAAAGEPTANPDELSMAAMETDAALEALATEPGPEAASLPGQLQSAHKAFVKGRESGIWQGAKQVQLQDLETQWDTYKAGTKRGLELPNLADVHQRSVALAESGFTTADSPNIRASTRSAIHLPAAGSKRKAGDIDETGAEKLEPAQQPPAKRQTPAKRAAWNSPFRPARTAVPRIPSASALQPRDNVDASLTPSGRKILHAKRTLSLKEPSVPDKPAEAIARDTQPGPARKLAPPKPPSHVDRAKKAAEVFTARRAAALAKARE
ncbi:hypothetical protein WJX74_008261 [Apatococcus lobatus]|uniref:SAP domain-containing protein n=1 Tax=Apatococcus lobatus TaxID=904363 RepID=A0AAW1RTX0_9CHLO